MTQDGKDELVRLNVAARELGVTSQTMKKYCRCQLLRCEQLPSGQWRVRRSSLDDLKKSEGIPDSTDNLKSPCVYFVRCQQFVKIGWAGHLRDRLRGVQTFMPWTLEVLYEHRCESEAEAKAVEVKAHADLSDHRFRGEWFYDTPAIQAYIANLKP